MARSLSLHSKWAVTPREGDTRDAYAEQIARRLITTRRALNLTQADLCRSSGIQPNTYNQYEKAKNIISLTQALRLCKTLGLTLDWIYMGDPIALPARVIQALAAQARS